jgi:hypothetical protein
MKFLLTLLITLNLTHCLDFCSSMCIDITDVCNSPSFGDCTVCAVSIYSMIPDSTGCVKLNQT